MGLIARLLLNERAKFDRNCGELQTTRPFPEDVEEIRDIPYLPDSESVHRMDVYRPKGAEGPLPVVLDVHGGGLALGSKAYNRWFNAQLCRRGFLVYCADYRLVPEHRVFDAYADISAAMDGGNPAGPGLWRQARRHFPGGRQRRRLPHRLPHSHAAVSSNGGRRWRSGT